MLDFIIAHKVAVFYSLMALLLFIFRKKFQFYFKVIALYRTNRGLRLMDRIAGRHSELVKLIAYVGIGVGFIGMILILVLLVQGAISIVTNPSAPPPISPVLPGVKIPGVPAAFEVPLIGGLIAIFVIAVVHEFAHGVVARAHGVAVKSSGPAIVGPLFAAFVELDDKQAAKKSDVANYSIFAAGAFANIIMAFFILLVISMVFVPVSLAFFPEQGVALKDVTPGSPADIGGLKPGMALERIDNQLITTSSAASAYLQRTQPNQTVVFNDGAGNYTVTAGSSKELPGRGFFGIFMEPVFRNGDTPYFRVFSWLNGLIVLTASLSFGIGLANLIPFAPVDGGKMLFLALTKIRGAKSALKIMAKINILLMLLILFLLTPIFKAIFASIAGLF